MNRQKMQEDGIVQLVDLRTGVPAGLWFKTSKEKDPSGFPRYTRVHFNLPEKDIAFGIEDQIAVIFIEGRGSREGSGGTYQLKLLVLDIKPDSKYPGWMTITGLQKESKEIVKEN